MSRLPECLHQSTLLLITAAIVIPFIWSVTQS